MHAHQTGTPNWPAQPSKAQPQEGAVASADPIEEDSAPTAPKEARRFAPNRFLFFVFN
jgi:hypothetical protein